jgi:acyl-CoA synthetase (AMP-forming)/AMP-acid ligase II
MPTKIANCIFGMHRPAVGLGDPHDARQMTFPSIISGRTLSRCAQGGRYEDDRKFPLESARSGWFFTGDVVSRAPDGYIRIVARRATDLIETAGYKVGAGEVEKRPPGARCRGGGGCNRAARRGSRERIAAFVVLRGDVQCSPQELTDYVATWSLPTSVPARLHFVDGLPRNEMGRLLRPSSYLQSRRCWLTSGLRAGFP